jgi:hypothetical protein
MDKLGENSGGPLFSNCWSLAIFLPTSKEWVEEETWNPQSLSPKIELLQCGVLVIGNEKC